MCDVLRARNEAASAALIHLAGAPPAASPNQECKRDCRRIRASTTIDATARRWGECVKPAPFTRGACRACTMPRRRNAEISTAVVTVLVVVLVPLSAAAKPRPDYEVIIVGSGFGGSIASLQPRPGRINALVLERGRDWRNAVGFSRRAGMQCSLISHARSGGALMLAQGNANATSAESASWLLIGSPSLRRTKHPCGA
jgi:hypothetical protein